GGWGAGGGGWGAGGGVRVGGGVGGGAGGGPRGSRARLFRRLALLYPPTEILRARRALIGPSRRLRAQAREYMEAVLSARHAAVLTPLLADVPDQDRYRLAAAGPRLAGPSLSGPPRDPSLA